MQRQAQLEFRSVLPSDAETLWAAINSVAAERWFIATIQFSPEDIRGLVEKSIETSMPHVLALQEEVVVGWCDIVPGKAANGARWTISGHPADGPVARRGPAVMSLNKPGPRENGPLTQR